MAGAHDVHPAKYCDLEQEIKRVGEFFEKQFLLLS